MINTRLTTSTTLTAGANIPVGNVVHKNCCKVSASGNTWTIAGAGYFKIIYNVTVEPTAVAPMTVSLLNNGATIATATATPAIAGDAVNLTVIAVVYSRCGCTDKAITATVSAGVTVTEADAIIEGVA